MEELTPIFNIEDDLFNFESDHLALKGNRDYCEVLKTLVILTAQRENALKDYQKITELKVKALNEPFETLENIQNGSSLGVPPLPDLPKLPTIDLKKYNVPVPEQELKTIYSDMVSEEKPDIKNINTGNNRAWSPEEQKKLEELLQTYPPEPIEMRRFQKIAKALGNRTVHQVSSRVQKYFLKLYRAGLPIPGRIPKSVEKYKKSALHKHQRHNHYLWKPTSFFPELNVPVQMDDLDDSPGPSGMPPPNPTTSSCSTPTKSTGNYLLHTDYHQSSGATMDTFENKFDTESEMQLNLLKRIRKEKSKEHFDGYSPFSHAGYRCDYCDEDPITGSRWHCTTCPGSIDFCTDCVLSQMYSENPHSLHHRLVIYSDDLENRLELNELSDPLINKGYDRQISEELKDHIGMGSEDSDGEEFSE